jgi:hypothetical protein
MCYLRRCIWPFALYLIGFAVFFRYQLYSNFDLQFGHRADDLFIIFIHEHVFQWILGQNNFLSPPYYFDQSNIRAIVGGRPCELSLLRQRPYHSFYLLVVRIDDFSLFRFLYSVVLGAGAVRVGYRGMLVANLFATVSIAMNCDRLFGSLSHFNAAHLAMQTLLIGLLVVAVVEQFNFAQSAALSRSFEREQLARIGCTPGRCRTFYVADEPGYSVAAVQLDAMIVAMTRRLPTINGYSGFRPPDWDFYDTKDQNYERRAVNWASRRGLASGLCRLDIQLGAWTAADNDPALACLIKRCVPLARTASLSLNLNKEEMRTCLLAPAGLCRNRRGVGGHQAGKR